MTRHQSRTGRLTGVDLGDGVRVAGHRRVRLVVERLEVVPDRVLRPAVIPQHVKDGYLSKRIQRCYEAAAGLTQDPGVPARSETADLRPRPWRLARAADVVEPITRELELFVGEPPCLLALQGQVRVEEEASDGDGQRDDCVNDEQPSAISMR